MAKKKLELIVTAENRDLFQYYIRIMYTYYFDKSYMPSRLAKSTLDMIVTKEKHEMNSYRKKADIDYKLIEKFIINNPDYDLGWKFKITKEETNLKNNFEIFAKIMLLTHYQNRYDPKNERKKDEIEKFFYQRLKDDVTINSKNLSKNTYYKKIVLSGVFSNAVGLKDAKFNLYKPKQIFDSIKHKIKS